MIAQRIEDASLPPSPLSRDPLSEGRRSEMVNQSRLSSDVVLLISSIHNFITATIKVLFAFGRSDRYFDLNRLC